MKATTNRDLLEERLAELTDEDRAEAHATRVARWAREDAALTAIRNAVGLTQVELADKLGVSQSQVSRLESRGAGVAQLSTIERYVHALGGEVRLLVKLPGHEPVALEINEIE